jgi:modulator of FtsH protease
MQDKPIFNSQAIGIEATTSTNSVLRNTYMLLAMTLAFSAVTAGIALAAGVGFGLGLAFNLAAIGLLWFVLPRTANSANGLITVFGITGLLGAGLGPLLNHYLHMAGGGQLVLQALGGTALVFFGLSAYALTTRKDFSFAGGFLMVGMIVVLMAGIANIFFQVPAAYLAINAAIVLLMSVAILFHTSAIIHGGERNYIMATVSLYMAIYNLFVSLLQLLGVFGSDD